VGGPYASIVQALVDDRAKLTRLSVLVDEELDIPLPQAGAVMCFVDAYPQFWPNLKLGMREIRFCSTTA